MGMYTELQGTVKFKNEEIAGLFTEANWESIALIQKQVEQFNGYSRCNWIPGEINSLEGSIVKFHSELKDYDNTIERFLNILPFIAEKWCLESRYEECSNWTLHRNDQEDIPVNGDNYYEREWSWGYGSKKLEEIVYPDFDVFDKGNLT